MSVVEADGTGARAERTHVFKRVAAGVEVGVLAQDLIAPREGTLIRAAAGFFPFHFGGQAAVVVFAIAPRAEPGDHGHRMIFVACLDSEGFAIKFDSLRWVIQWDEEPIARFDLFFVLDSAELIAWVKADDLIAVNFDIAIRERRVEKVCILGGGHIGDHDLVGFGGFDIFVLSEVKFTSGDLRPGVRVNACVEGGNRSVQIYRGAGGQ